MPTCVESFCGAGGMSLGLKQAGFELLAAFDADKTAIKTYNANLGPHGFYALAEELAPRYLLKKIGLQQGELDLFSGGPPCQGFSLQKRGSSPDDKRNFLVLRFARLVKYIQPKTFLFENVAAFGKKRGAAFRDEMAELLADYELTADIYNTADFGVAQTRKRFVIVGKRKDIAGSFEIPTPTVEKWVTVSEALAGLPHPPDDYSDHPEFPNHRKTKESAISIDRFKHVPAGGGWQDIPPELQLECHKKAVAAGMSGGKWSDVYGRLDPDGQAPTITRGFSSFTRGRYGHPKEHRSITAREAARLMGFPDDFTFFGTQGDIRSQIGNAVPPPLAKAVGEQILKLLSSQVESPKGEIP